MKLTLVQIEKETLSEQIWSIRRVSFRYWRDWFVLSFAFVTWHPMAQFALSSMNNVCTGVDIKIVSGSPASCDEIQSAKLPPASYVLYTRILESISEGRCIDTFLFICFRISSSSPSCFCLHLGAKSFKHSGCGLYVLVASWLLICIGWLLNPTMVKCRCP